MMQNMQNIRGKQIKDRGKREKLEGKGEKREEGEGGRRRLGPPSRTNFSHN